MGNRATVIFTDDKETNISPAVYLHWNGGPESIYAFLSELQRRDVRPDQEYEVARFIQLVGEFLDQDKIGGLSLGVTNGPEKITPEELAKVQTDHGDNGFYIVHRNDGGDVRMKRFTMDWDAKELVETPPESVERERAAAIKDDYAKQFEETYLKIQGDRELG